MIALKIISTIFLGLSCVSTFLKNVLAFHDDKTDTFHTKTIFIGTFYGWLWRALVIVTIWVV